MRKTIASLAIAGLIVGAFAAPAIAGKKKRRKAPKPVPVETTLFFHGTEQFGELDTPPLVGGPVLPMDATEPSGEEKSKMIDNYVVGPNVQCAGNNLFGSWLGDVVGKVSEVKVTFAAIGTPGLVDVNVWADIPGGTDYCNENYPAAHASALGVALPAGDGMVEATLEVPAAFPATATLLVQISPSATPDPTGTPRPLTNMFVSRIKYDSEAAPSAITFMCAPPANKTSCTP